MQRCSFRGFWRMDEELERWERGKWETIFNLGSFALRKMRVFSGTREEHKLTGGKAWQNPCNAGFNSGTNLVISPLRPALSKIVPSQGDMSYIIINTAVIANIGEDVWLYSFPLRRCYLQKYLSLISSKY